MLFCIVFLCYVAKKHSYKGSSVLNLFFYLGPVSWDGDSLLDDQGLELWYKLLQVPY